MKTYTAKCIRVEHKIMMFLCHAQNEEEAREQFHVMLQEVNNNHLTTIHKDQFVTDIEEQE